MSTIKLNNTDYYLITDFLETHKSKFNSKILNNPRDFLKKYSNDLVVDGHACYIFGIKEGDKWVLSKKENLKAKVLLEKAWVDSEYGMSVQPQVNDIPQPVMVVPTIEELEQAELGNNQSESCVKKKVIIKRRKKTETPESEESYIPLPPILTLTDEEKFKDEQGNPLEIEVRGERNPNGIYFRLKDVSETFEMINLSDTMKESNSNYKRGVDYICFVQSDTTPSNRQKKIKFITYKGMLKLLFRSRCGKANQFVDWAVEKLFTHQMGSKEQRQELATNLLGIPYDQVKKHTNVMTDETSCLYLTIIGQVQELRESMKIDAAIHDDKFVCKIGRTNDLGSRIAGHKYDFKMKGANLQLKKIVSIDPHHLSQAETELKNKLQKFKFNFENYQELILLSKEDFDFVEERFKIIRLTYGSHKFELENMIANLHRQIEREQDAKKMLEMKFDFELEKNKNLLEKNEHLLEKIQLMEKIHKLELKSISK